MQNRRPALRSVPRRVETAPRRFAEYPLGIGGSVGARIRGSCSDRMAGVGDRCGIAHGLVFLIARSAVHMATTLASLSVGGNHPAACQCRPATTAARIGTPVPSIPRYMVDFTALIGPTQLRSSSAISAPNVSAARSTCLTLTSDSRQLVRLQRAAFRKAHQGRRAAGHPQNSWREGNSSRRKARSRGQNPLWHGAQG